MTLGFTDERFGGGFQCVLAVDNDKAALETHNRNFRAKEVLANIEDWITGQSEIPLADVVIGGLPCQGFSLLNKKRLTDSRRSLWNPYMDVVEQCRASVFVMENVQGILQSKEYDAIQKYAEKNGLPGCCKCSECCGLWCPSDAPTGNHCWMARKISSVSSISTSTHPLQSENSK
jgi:DNA (cytosine-5)-methyltransferase 1